MRHFNFVLLASLLLLGGCQSAAQRALAKTPDYRAGYSDGCSSAGSRGANMRGDNDLVRDQNAYENNKAYRAGWGSGFGACRGSQPGAGMPGGPDRGPIPDPGTLPF